jgi:ABC-type multidrug transport system ATPase subunit
LVFAAIALGIYFFYKWKLKADAIHQLQKAEKFSLASQIARVEEKPDVGRLEKTFDIRFDDLGLKLPNGVEIMKGVTGELRSGRTCAIMGPSGSGKTTFVTLLTGKQPRTSGNVLINGQPDELSRYSKLIGYVPQEDVMIRELKVRQILMHSARMRLPRSWDSKRVYQKVEEIINFLGMSHVTDSIIGNEEERGISGGQRKRVNIGMELVAEPSVLFLDEPTSGLDSSTSFEVCRNLRNIAHKQGLTVAAVIHSPSPATFRQFDDFMLLGKGGQVVYIGPREHAKPYFQEIGFTCPPGDSESDFFMDVVSGHVASEYNPEFKPSDLFQYWNKKQQGQLSFAGMARMTPEMAAQSRRDRLRGIKREATLKQNQTERPNDYYGYTDAIAAGIADMGRDVLGYLMDIGTEFFYFIKAIVFAIFQQPDPVRETQPFYMKGYFLMKRAFHQVFVIKSILTDLALNFAAGLFISIAIQEFQFIGSNPDPMCAYTPRNLQPVCFQPIDKLRY